MPDRFETAIVDKVIKEQEKKTLEFTQISAVISEEIALEQAKADKDIAILNAQVGPVAIVASSCVHGANCVCVRHRPLPTAPSSLKQQRLLPLRQCRWELLICGWNWRKLLVSMERRRPPRTKSCCITCTWTWSVDPRPTQSCSSTSTSSWCPVATRGVCIFVPLDSCVLRVYNITTPTSVEKCRS